MFFLKDLLNGQPILNKAIKLKEATPDMLTNIDNELGP